MILFENTPTFYFERVEDYEEKSTPWRRVPPAYKGSSTKSGRNKKQIRRDRKRNKKRQLCRIKFNGNSKALQNHR